jgi:hypothetical protein
MLAPQRTQRRHYQSARASRSRHLSVRTLTKLNRALPNLDCASASVCVIHNPRWHLFRQIQQIGRRGFRRLETNAISPRNRRRDGVRGSREFPQQRMRAGDIVEPAPNTPQLACPYHALERHPNGVCRAKIKKIRTSEDPVGFGSFQPLQDSIAQAHGPDNASIPL